MMQDAERMEKVSQRVQQLESIQNNVQLLNEMVAQYRSDGTTTSERDVMKVRSLIHTYVR